MPPMRARAWALAASLAGSLAIIPGLLVMMAVLLATVTGCESAPQRGEPDRWPATSTHAKSEAVTKPKPSESTPAPAAAKPEAAPPVAKPTTPETYVGADQVKVLQGARDQVLARVGDAEVRASDLYKLMFVSFNRETTDAIKKCIVNIIVAKEAALIGARVPESQIAAEQDRLLSEQKRQFHEAYKGSASFEDYVSDNLRLDPAAYQNVLRQAVLESLFLERVVRFESRLEERRAARVLVVRDKTKAETLRRDLEAGASFDSLARKESMDPTREQGGLLPALPSSFKSPLTNGVETLTVGTLSPVLEMGDGTVTLYKVMRLEEILPADLRPYAEQEAELTHELESRPVHPAEFLAWDKKMRQRYAIADYVGREPPATN